jgi:hypothetical protein
MEATIETGWKQIIAEIKTSQKRWRLHWGLAKNRWRRR